MHGFIDKKSWKSLLGKMSKDIVETDNYVVWKVNKKTNLVLLSDFFDLDEFVPFTFHYFSESQISSMKKKYIISSSLVKSICFDLEKVINLSGRANKGIRTRINRCNKMNLEILDNYKTIQDVEDFVKIWSKNYSDKYFWDFSSKNLEFYRNNFHIDCNNVFIYFNNVLKAYGTASDNSYIIGKAQYNNDIGGISGLSEFLDIELYKKVFASGKSYINLGRSSTKNLLKYKEKFPGKFEIREYSGKCLKKI